MVAKKKRVALDGERILDAAQALIEDKGLEGWSMRGLASELDVEPMSLYHWFPSRNHVLDGLLDRFAEDLVVPAEGSWDERLLGLARIFRAAAMRFPAFFPFAAVHRFNTLHTLERLEWLLAFFALEFPEAGARAAAFRLFTHWLVGFTLDATSGFSKGPSAQDPPDEAFVAEHFPTVMALGPFNRDDAHDELFEIGLRAILAAIHGLKR